jgi:hypothetical protein
MCPNNVHAIIWSGKNQKKGWSKPDLILLLQLQPSFFAPLQAEITDPKPTNPIPKKRTLKNRNPKPPERG